MAKTFVIGEIAACHDGDYEKALRLIDLCAEIGVDAVKTQWCSSPESLARRRAAPEYISSYQLLNFPESWHAALATYCNDYNLEYMCTVYLLEDIQVIAPYVQRFKVASFEAWDGEFVKVVAQHASEKNIIISSGLNSYPLVEYFDYHDAIDWLHCVSAYPTPIEEINLGAIREDPEWLYSGISDHTKHPQTGAYAVCAGARIIEFHLRLHDTNFLNADYVVARHPGEAKTYVENIRTAEAMMGNGVKRVMPSEEKMLRYRVKG